MQVHRAVTTMVAAGLLCALAAAGAPAAQGKTGIFCAKKAGSNERTLRSKPSTCITLGPQDSFSEAVWLFGARWSRWGKATAYGRGFERGFREQAQRIPVKLRAYRRQRCAPGIYVYARLRARSKFGVTTVRFENCGS